MMSYNLKDYVKIYDGCISHEMCDNILTQFKDPTYSWEKHGFYSYTNNKTTSYEDDLSVSMIQTSISGELHQIVWNTLQKYLTEMNFKWFGGWSGFTTIRYNKYDVGTRMRLHCDHIHSMFDGNRKGIPTLSVLGALNDDYEGGDLMFWDSEKIELKAGQIMIFPSNFLYPHEVLPVTRGERHSFVSWVW